MKKAEARRTATGGTRSEQTRSRILAAAAQVMRTHTYAELRLSDIAKVANMETGSLYYHFDSKDDLVNEVTNIGLGKLNDVADEAAKALPESATPLERLEACLRAFTVEIHSSDDFIASAVRVLGQLPTSMQGAYWHKTVATATFWDRMFAAAVASGELRADLHPGISRRLVLSAIMRSAEWPKSERKHPELIAETLIAITFEGLKAKGDAIPF
ncbi:TetR/AcrR family transcriptional regulator [Amycolatopsis sp. K13G38]|uniref:TetR/AcrR family transcriptional regulator n=1 Tax=Amycolatopsis acididurans TaxID=2724524 RepID=A0ABX1J8H5_9PSEU|nr:TetR/AcrR family transcriptional regulator [Amycolatopsis acididurans]NKQ56100.1 TetR/AcrR family transcriptional regulator [Amycolatopsis acididurans]